MSKNSSQNIQRKSVNKLVAGLATLAMGCALLSTEPSMVHADSQTHHIGTITSSESDLIISPASGARWLDISIATPYGESIRVVAEKKDSGLWEITYGDNVSIDSSTGMVRIPFLKVSGSFISVTNVGADGVASDAMTFYAPAF